MTIKNLLSSLIGVWFLFIPWMFGFQVNGTAAKICFLFGGLQMVCSLLAIEKSRKRIFLNVVSLFIGIGFIIFPNAYNLNLLEIVIMELLGLTTILLNYAVVFPESQ